MKLTTVQKWFNLYIRLKKSDENGTCRCVTCRKLFYYKEGDAGHYIPSTKTIHRFNEDNVHPQCMACNRFHGGAGSKYTLWMIDNYGREFVDALHRTENKPKPYSPVERKELSKKYRELARKLQKEKALN